MTHLVRAYLNCRRTKRNSVSALAFEAELERNLSDLYDELVSGTYQPGRTACFVVLRPRPREVWAADFRDRIVHHALYDRLAERFHRAFIADSCACIPGRGTLYAAQRLERHVRSLTQSWQQPAWYLKCDLANFFVAIDKRRLFELLCKRITQPWWRQLAETVLFHDPRQDVELRSSAAMLARVPPHKSLFNAPADTGLPIGNLSSQFFANVYLDVLDQHVKHQLRIRHYVRYVDDFVLLHRDPAQLAAALKDIEAFLPARLAAHLNPRKTILQPAARGIDFVGHLIKPWRCIPRRRTVHAALARLEHMTPSEIQATGNSYLGLLRQDSHSHTDRARIAKALRYRGRTVAADFTRMIGEHREH